MEVRRQGAPLNTLRLGVTLDEAGATVGVFSSIATLVSVSVFDDDGAEERHPLPNRFGDVHYGHIPGMRAGQQYGIRLDGPWEPSRGLLCNPAKLLIDPYAQAVVGELDWTGAVFGATEPGGHIEDPEDSSGSVPRSVVVDHTDFDWGDDRPLRRPWHDTVIYETHVKSLTMLHPDVPPEFRGTYAGMATPPIVEHLTDLGITAIELMPVQHHVDDESLWRRRLHNHWGYQPIAWCAPHHGYAADQSPTGAVTELKHLVKTMHAAGIEVILDVVYNHTAEIDHTGPHLSFRGLDNPAYYRLDPHHPSRYRNFAGTGNTVNTDSPALHDLVVESLRGWVSNYHIDGFRFDLATTLGRRGLDARFDTHAPLLQAITNDPVLVGAKLIAEPWDVGPEGYQLGRFPHGWAEWNDKYRQTMRDFWRGKPGVVDVVATRMMGSRDIFHHRKPTATVNYITAHDGYTLTDLVSYEQRHNHANGEDNRDGSPDNRSWNGGHEGPTDDPDIMENRSRRRRSLLTSLLLSAGVPMLLGGDELGRTQRGNNNAYAQDNEVSWYDWENLDREFVGFVQRLVRLRRETAGIGSGGWLEGDRPETGRAEAVWFGATGTIMSDDEWRDPERHTVSVAIHPIDGWRRVGRAHLVLINGGTEDVKHVVPELPYPGPSDRWVTVADTASEETGAEWIAGDSIPLPAHTAIVLRNLAAPQ